MIPTDDSDSTADALSRAVQSIVRPEDLKAVRHLVTNIARAAGLLGQRCDQLVLAVSEVATNALRHSAKEATMLVYTSSHAVTVDIHDHSDRPIPPGPTTPPSGDELHGRGLWLATQVCDHVETRRLPTGNVVRLVMSL